MRECESSASPPDEASEKEVLPEHKEPAGVGGGDAVISNGSVFEGIHKPVGAGQLLDMMSLSLFNFLGRVPRKKLFKNEVTMLMLARQLTR